MKAVIYDATLREGAQGAGASFTVEDKLKIVDMLDELGVSYIEAGNPGSNPKDAAFFERMQNHPLKQAKLTAFGATCRVGVDPKDDANIQALMSANTPVVCIFGKSWDFHVTEILKATLEENLAIIAETVRYFKQQGKEVVYDAEHFFDGYKNNPEYALRTLESAHNAGADWLCLCETNGGTFPNEIEAIFKDVAARFNAKLGIHAHNDTGMAEANAVMAALNGATMVQVTIAGWGERCGNTDLFTLLPNLQLKLGFDCLPPEKLQTLVSFAHTFHELANLGVNPRAPYVGFNAFAHKAGMHIDAVAKNPTSFEHVPPALVGAERAFLISEVAGRTAVLKKIQRIVPDVQKDSPDIRKIVEQLKQLEYQGYQFEGADASFELMVLRTLGLHKPFFTLKGFKVIVNEPAPDGKIASAMVHILVDGVEEVTAAIGNGPVNALDIATRKALERFYPSLNSMVLSDYRVRVLDSKFATAAPVRVLIESSDAQHTWTTVGVSTDIIEASWHALVDSLEYKLFKDNMQKKELSAKEESIRGNDHDTENFGCTFGA
ncbi:MAG: citramalate synthase [Bacillota bacterium]